VFWDKNGDGTQEPDEPGIPNVDVAITDNKGTVQIVTSDDLGLYMANVPVGPAVTDIIDTTSPEGSLQTAGTDPTRLSVPEDGTSTDSDGFDLPTGKLEGIVFEDKNGNAVKDPNESGFEGVDVIVTDSLGTSQTAVTDDEGTYEAVVLAGSIAIDIVESTLPATGSVQTAGTNPTTIDVPADGTATDLDGYNFVSASPSDSPSESPSATPALWESKRISQRSTNRTVHPRARKWTLSYPRNRS
jgi:hypothetical protein